MAVKLSFFTDIVCGDTGGVGNFEKEVVVSLSSCRVYFADGDNESVFGKIFSSSFIQLIVYVGSEIDTYGALVEVDEVHSVGSFVDRIDPSINDFDTLLVGFAYRLGVPNDFLECCVEFVLTAGSDWCHVVYVFAGDKVFKETAQRGYSFNRWCLVCIDDVSSSGTVSVRIVSEFGEAFLAWPAISAISESEGNFNFITSWSLFTLLYETSFVFHLTINYTRAVVAMENMSVRVFVGSPMGRLVSSRTGGGWIDFDETSLSVIVLAGAYKARRSLRFWQPYVLACVIELACYGVESKFHWLSFRSSGLGGASRVAHRGRRSLYSASTPTLKALSNGFNLCHWGLLPNDEREVLYCG